MFINLDIGAIIEESNSLVDPPQRNGKETKWITY